MGFYLSPGVYTKETDLSGIVGAVATSIGVIVGASNKGPLSAVLTTNTKQFIERYGKPTPGNPFHYSCLAFLNTGRMLYPIRVIDNGDYGGVIVRNNLVTEIAPVDTVIPDPENYEFVTDDLFLITGATPGTWNNDLNAEISEVDDDEHTFKLKITDDAGEPLEERLVSRIKSMKDAQGVSLYICDVFKDNSTIKIVDHTTEPETPITIVTSVGLDKGVDGSVYGGVIVSNNAGTTEIVPVATGGVPDPIKYSFGGDDLFLVVGANPGIWNNDLSIKIVDVDNSDNTFVVEIWEDTVLLDHRTVSRISTKKDGFGQSMYIEDVFAGNAYIRVVDSTTLETPHLTEVTSAVDFEYATNGSMPTTGQIINGWKLISDPDKITVNLLISGGQTSEIVLTEMIRIAENRKDCFCILDAPAKNTVTDLVAWRKSTLKANTSYAALYAPFVEIYDSYNDKRLFIPPSGYIGGRYAYTDYEREPWYAPAGLNNGILSVLDVQHYYDLGARDALYSAQINPIRQHPAGGIVVWGQKTLQTKPSATDRVNVRRLLIIVEKAIATMLDYFVMEQNSDFTRRQISLIIEGYLRLIKASEGLRDFKIVVEDTNNSGAIIDRNELHVDIYLKPVRVAEFIVLNTIITSTGVSFEEVLLPSA